VGGRQGWQRERQQVLSPQERRTRMPEQLQTVDQRVQRMQREQHDRVGCCTCFCKSVRVMELPYIEGGVLSLRRACQMRHVERVVE
jgi:hypothetical protein